MARSKRSRASTASANTSPVADDKDTATPSDKKVQAPERRSNRSAAKTPVPKVC